MKKKRALIIVLGIFLLIQPISAQTWTATKRIAWNSGLAYHPAIAVDSNNHIHVVWFDDTLGNDDICYKKSTDGGVTWYGVKKLTWNSGDSRWPAIAVDSNNHIHVVWFDLTPGNNEIYYKRSTNAGVTWDSAKRLTWTSGNSYYPAIAIGQSDSIHIIWYDVTPGNAEIYYKKSSNGGSTWTTKRLTWNNGFSSISAIAVDSINHIHVVWQDSTSGNPEIYYKKSTDGGTTWVTKRLTFNSGWSNSPSIAVDSSNNIHVVWHDDSPGNWEIYYKKSTDGGVTWAAKRLTWNSDISSHTATAVDSSDNIHIVWDDGPGGNKRLYYKKSMDGGITWSSRRLSWSYSTYPDISIDPSNNIHLVWEGPSHVAIYYKKGIQ